MSGKRYPEEFKIEPVKQVVDRGHSVSSVATRLDTTTLSLYAWIKKYGPDLSTNKEQSGAHAGIRRLQKELKRVTDERDILSVLRKTARLKYAFISDNTCCWPVRLLCQVLDVHPSGFNSCLPQPPSQRHQVDRRLIGRIKQFWLESGCVYGYRKIHLDLQDSGATVWSEQSLATGETCRDKGSGRIPESVGTQRRSQYRVGQQVTETVQSGCSGRALGNPTSGSTKAACIWPWLLTCSHIRSSAGQCSPG